MITQSTRFVVCLGLLAGSLAIATTAHAQTAPTSSPTAPSGSQIPVTGGRVTGDAAFFTPAQASVTGPTGTSGTTPVGSPLAPMLFDATVRTLRIETPNGTTTTSRFTPTAARFKDVNNNGIPDANDTGRLEGSLSGVAFSPSGSPVFFQNVPTALNFTLNSFTSSLEIPGTLISPILPPPPAGTSTGSTSGTTTGTTTGGTTTGSTGGTTTGGTTGGTTTGSTGGTTTGGTTTGSTGGTTTGGTTTGSTGGTTTGTQPPNAPPPVFIPNFFVTLSSTSSSQFKADFGQLAAGPFDAKLTGDFIALPATLQFTSSGSTVELPPSYIGRRTKFELSGKGTPDLAQSDSNPTDGKIAFVSTDGVTNFKLQSIGTPGTREFKIEGTATGADIRIGGINNFTLKNFPAAVATNYKVSGTGVGVTSLVASSSVGFTSANSSTQFNIEQPSNGFSLQGKSQGLTAFSLGAVQSNVTNYTVNQQTTQTDTSDFSNSTAGSVASGTTPSTTTNTANPPSVNSNSTSNSTTTYITVFTLSSLSGTSNNTYTVYQTGTGRFELSEQGRGRGRALGRKKDKFSDNEREGQFTYGDRTYVLVGPPSRVFPGLIGLRQLPATSTSTTGTSGSTSTTGTTTTGTGTTTTGTSGSTSTTGTTTTGTGTSGTDTTTPTGTTTTGTGTSGTGTTTTGTSGTGTTTTTPTGTGTSGTGTTTTPAGTSGTGTTTTP